MGHYNRDRSKDCTDKGNTHTWSSLKITNQDVTVVARDGTPHLKISWTQYRDCQTKMEYHGGRGIGMTEGRVCNEEKDRENKSVELPMNILGVIAEASE